eukprot:gene22281-biopygen1158
MILCYWHNGLLQEDLPPAPYPPWGESPCWYEALGRTTHAVHLAKAQSAAPEAKATPVRGVTPRLHAQCCLPVRLRVCVATSWPRCGHTVATARHIVATPCTRCARRVQ